MNHARNLALLLAALGLAAASLHTAAPARGHDHVEGLTAVPTALLARAESMAAPQLPWRMTAWVAPGEGRHVIDDFEADAWPDRRSWVAAVDLDAPADPAFVWAPRDCRAAAGQRSLWAVGGGSAGSVLPCDGPAPRPRQASAVLALDLAALRGAAALDLLLDVWADAGPTEGLLVNMLRFGPGGDALERRVVYSATGRSTEWSREVRIDLTRLEDRLDPLWRGDLRGQLAYLELLYLAAGDAPAGQGIFVDNIAIEAVAPTPVVVTPRPEPTVTPAATAEIERTEACDAEPDCRTLQVWAYVDYRCDRRFQPGVDERVVSQPRVHITAGAEQLGTRLDNRGYATFRLRVSSGASITLTEPDGLTSCANAANPIVMEPTHFAAYGLSRVEFRLQRSR